MSLSCTHRNLSLRGMVWVEGKWRVFFFFFFRPEKSERIKPLSVVVGRWTYTVWEPVIGTTEE